MFVSVDDELYSDAVLRMEMPRRRTPQTAFTSRQREDDSVREIGIYFQRNGPAVEKPVAVAYRRTVVEPLVAPVYGFVTRHGGTSDVEEKRVRGIGEEPVVVAALGRKLRHRNASGLVGIVARQVLDAEDPLVGMLRVAAHRNAEIVSRILARSGAEPVDHAAPKLDAAHPRQGTLGVCFVPRYDAQSQQQNEYRPFHVI